MAAATRAAKSRSDGQVRGPARWSYAAAVRAGTVHGDGSRCQDHCACRLRDGVLTAVVSDGAGSAAHGAQGAEAAVQAFVEASSALGPRPSRAQNALLKGLFSTVQQAVEGVSESGGSPLTAFACTLVGVVASESGALVMQVGDGAAVIGLADGFVVPLRPEAREYVNETSFVTSPDARHRVQTARIHEPVLSVVLVTDGLQDSVIGRSGLEPHAPFFESVTARLDDETPGHDARAAAWLATVLASEPVTSRTDDDTCIVVARRLRADA